ncbi:hypothetical protein BCL67_1345 [Nesterenkonia sandarakina]|uniref:Uncharacterized protein n=1 Tax=Nesterenkonia sandarakina TaxID=272918 RepID=A0A2T0YAJ6_9MICC|nr:hypothetical protein BCL67_1345 [Nesterenkonia sandarakina]
MARPSKGERQGVTSKLSPSYFEKLDRLCALTGETKVDYIARVLMADLDSVDVLALEGQEPLPMSA